MSVRERRVRDNPPLGKERKGKSIEYGVSSIGGKGAAVGGWRLKMQRGN